MSKDSEKTGRARFLRALEVRKNAIRGFGAGGILTVLVVVAFVVLPGSVAEALRLRSLGLALTLVLALGGLLTTILVALRARRLHREF